jgi:hypothetical protein
MSWRGVYNELGRYTVDVHRQKLAVDSRKVPACGNIDPSHPINMAPNIMRRHDLDFYQRLSTAVPKEVCVEFRQYLKAEKNECKEEEQKG